MRASIPLPIACKAIALPFELITLKFAFPIDPFSDHTKLLSTSSSYVMAVCCKCFFDGAFQCSDSAKEQYVKPICIGCENTESVTACYHLSCSVGTSILFCQMINYLQRNPTHHICYIRPRYLSMTMVTSRSVYHLKNVTFLETQNDCTDLLKRIHVK